MVVLLLRKLSRQDEGEVVIVRDGLAVLAHWIPSPPATEDDSGVREPRTPHPPQGTGHLEIPADE